MENTYFWMEGTYFVGTGFPVEAAARLPALALVDIKLRGARDGIETACELQDRHHVPVVFVTASADAETVQRASMAQPADYMLKPFDPARLTRVVQTALG